MGKSLRLLQSLAFYIAGVMAMGLVTLKLSEALSDVNEFVIPVEKFSEITSWLERTEMQCYEALLTRVNGRLKIKPYVCVFINDQILLDEDITLFEGDVVELSLAIAGG